MQAVILAGGKGTRLKPFTTCIPKPLVPIDDMPILEYVIRQLKYYGFKDIVIAVNHLAELIMAFIGDGKRWGLNIRYSLEEEPLGTAGPLSIIDGLEDDFLVMNGDLLTTLNYRNFYEFHKTQKSIASVATYEKIVNIDLGVLKVENGEICDYIEKPEYRFTVSAGINMFNKRALESIPAKTRFDIPDLMKVFLKKGEKINCFKEDYYWLDIGRVSDYETAVEIIVNRKKEFLPE